MAVSPRLAMRSSGSNFTSVLQLVQAIGVRPERYCSKRPHHARFELFFEIDHIVRKISGAAPRALRHKHHPASRRCCAGPSPSASGAPPPDSTAAWSNQQSDAPAQEDGRHGRRIHAAGHGYSHKPSCGFSRSGQGIKLGSACSFTFHFAGQVADLCLIRLCSSRKDRPYNPQL